MPIRCRLWRACLALTGLIAGTAVFVAPAEANHHVMQIREVFPGTSDTSFVELQMWAGGQDVVAGQDITVYGPTGVLTHTFTFAGNPTGGGGDSGANQRTILVGESTAAGSPDFTDNGLNIPSGGGAVCFLSIPFGPIDCVSWGNFTGTLPSAAGDPAAPLGVTAGQSLERSIARNCSTLLDTADDSDQSADDFAQATPSPRNNSVTPTEVACASTSITKAPKNKSTDRTPTVKFTSFPLGGTFECRVDDDPFAPCTSPHTTQKLKPGKHTFKVQALGPGGPDPTPAKASFKIVKKH